MLADEAIKETLNKELSATIEAYEVASEQGLTDASEFLKEARNIIDRILGDDS